MTLWRVVSKFTVSLLRAHPSRSQYLAQQKTFCCWNNKDYTNNTFSNSNCLPPIMIDSVMTSYEVSTFYVDLASLLVFVMTESLPSEEFREDSPKMTIRIKGVSLQRILIRVCPCIFIFSGSQHNQLLPMLVVSSVEILGINLSLFIILGNVDVLSPTPY